MTVDNFKKLFDSMPVWRQCLYWNDYEKYTLNNRNFLIYPWDEFDIKTKHRTFTDIQEDHFLDGYETWSIRLDTDLHDHYCFYDKDNNEIRTFDNLYEFFDEDALEAFFEVMAAKVEKGAHNFPWEWMKETLDNEKMDMLQSECVKPQ